VKQLYLFLIATFLSITCAVGQRAQVEFGKNRMQFKNFNWRYYSTENFEIYFYDGGNEIARLGAEYLEEEFERITDILGYSSYYKTKIFLYNSISDLQQSNVGINEAGFDISGKTDFVRSQVEIAYPGTVDGYKKELKYNVAAMLINDMMYGGSLSDMFQSSYLLSLPDWFISGAASYVANGWDLEMDNYIRDLMQDKKLKKVTSFEDDEARLIGQSIWNFIAERYGESYISNILNLTRIVRNEEKSIAGTIGVSYKRFIADWNSFYTGQSDFVVQNYVFPDKENLVKNYNRDDYNFNKVKLSPEGNYLAYSRNVRGRYKVFVKNLNTGREKVLLRAGFKVINQEVDYNMPLLSWQSEGVLGIIYNKYGKNWIAAHTIGSGATVRKELSRINQITDFDIAKGSNLAVVSAERNGNNDLYLVSLKRNSIKRITNDLYDDINPSFIPETASIVFSSNRTTDSVFSQNKKISQISDVYNIFIYNIDSTKSTVHRVTNTLTKNFKPLAPNANEIYFLSEQQGVRNVFKYDLGNKLFFQVSNFGVNLENYDIPSSKDKLAFTAFYNNKSNIYLINGYDLDRNIFTTQTKRQQFINAKRVAERLLSNQKKRIESPDGGDEDETVDEEIEDRSVPERTSLLDQFDLDTTKYVDTQHYIFEETQPSKTGEQVEEKTDEKTTDSDGESDQYVDTDNYVFDTDVVKTTEEKTGSFLNKYRKLRKERDLVGPLDYKTRFTADNVVTTFVIDPLMGFGLNFQAQMNDLLEDHSFKGGIFVATDLRSSNFYGEYNYLKHLIDLKFRYDRKNVYRDFNQISAQKYIMNKFETTASLPLNVATRLSVTPFYSFTRYFELDPDGYIFQQGPPLTSTNHYLGVKTELVFDNTVSTGLNELQGTRGKIGFVHWEGMNNPQNNFSNIYLDIRNYQKIHREIVFATRLFYGRYWGPGQKTYLLGGMDNWLFNKTRNENTTNEEGVDELGFKQMQDNSDILFLEYVTSLRGFDYNTFNGSNTILFNAELRFPFIKYFYRGPISSNFLRNMLLIGFYDIGSAWTGSSPLATVNSINTEIIKPENNPFQAIIQNFRNPFLQSYGFGLRTVLLGYYMKFDLAYPIEDGIRKKPKFYATFGFDF